MERGEVRAPSRRRGTPGRRSGRARPPRRARPPGSGAPSAAAASTAARAHIVEARGGGHAHVPGLVEPGVHVVGAAPVPDRAHGRARGVEQLACGRVAEARPDRRPRSARATRRTRRCARSARGRRRPPSSIATRAPGSRLEQMPRRPHAGEAAADHHHIGALSPSRGRSGSGLARLLEPPPAGSVPLDPHRLMSILTRRLRWPRPSS